MSNEELAVQFQSGQRGIIGELWAQVERFVRKAAYSYGSRHKGLGGAEIADYEQAGFLAVYAAAGTFQPDSGALFTTWLSYYLRVAFAEVSGVRTNKRYREPLNYADSLSAPLGDEERSKALEDTLAAPDIWEGVDDDLWMNDAHTVIEACLESLPNTQGEILRRRYYAEQTREQVASGLGVSRGKIEHEEKCALRTLRSGWQYEALCKLLGQSVESMYTGIGLRAFKNSGMSSVEKYVLRQEERYESIMRQPS